MIAYSLWNLFLILLFLSCQPQLLAAVKFIAHLVNQQVAHEIIALELITVLLETPTDDSVEVAVGFVTECGSILQEYTPQGLHGEYVFIIGQAFLQFYSSRNVLFCKNLVLFSRFLVLHNFFHLI